MRGRSAVDTDEPLQRGDRGGAVRRADDEQVHEPTASSVAGRREPAGSRTAGQRGQRRLAVLVEGEDLQLDGEVDLAHVDPVRHREHAGREVEDAGHAGGDQLVGDRLRGGGRGGDHPDRDRLLGRDRQQLVDVPDDQAVDLLAHPGRIGVEEGGDPEPAAGEAGVAGQGVTEITDADQRDRAALGEPEDVLDLVDQQGDVVADAAGAVRAEVGQVLAQLGRVDPGRGGQSLAGDRVVAGFGEIVQCTQVFR